MPFKRFLIILGIYAMAEGFYRLFHPPQLIQSIEQAPELAQKAMDLTMFNMGLVMGGGAAILIALFIKK
ncbi:MAG: hypothetical protein HQL96_08670 [Magnetococcales bacterium]|nr:hypothetical protein [Magnetococcales bacterium]